MALEQPDVCIVGGGPAGMTLALLMLRSGSTVTVLERTRDFDREFRGEILQPGAMQLLDELGVLDGARRRGSVRMNRFQLIVHGRTDMDIDYGKLNSDFSFLLSIPQRHLLEELLAECRRYQRFSYHEGASIIELCKEGERVVGARYRQSSTEQEVAARFVVGADGRYSKTRRLAGIEFARQDSFAHDVLWFRVPLPADHPDNVRVYRSGGNPVLAYRSHPDALQLGWTLPHSGYREIAAHGFDYVLGQVVQAAPMFADEITRSIHKLSDLTLLDVFFGCSKKWVIDGLILIGDSAHTHGPIGAQGINLAIQDAALLHPQLVGALEANMKGALELGSYESLRRPDINAISVMQARQAGALLSTNSMANLVRPSVMRALAHTPLYGKTLQRLAFGRSPIAVRSDLFEAQPALW